MARPSLRSSLPCLAALVLALSACSAEDDPIDGPTSPGSGTGGAGVGGAPGATGGSSVGGASGGAAVGGLGGTPSFGGSVTGGAVSGGSGGSVSGGSGTGGSGTGGDSGLGGASTGGVLGTGGDPSTGGVLGTGGNQGTGGGTAVPLVGFATLNGGTTGGLGGETVTVNNYADLKSYAESSTPYIIRIEGEITNGAGGGQIRIESNKSLIGVGSTAFLRGVGLDVSSNNNVIIQNLRATLVGTTTPADVNGGDVISISGTSRNIWIDHCELFSEDPAVQTSIDKYDGLIDIKGQTGFITISWCYLHHHHKGGLVGASDTDLFADRKITLHHNYYNQVRLRIPMYRGSVGHFFNNYVVGATDASEIRAGTCVRVERNYYEALHYSIYTPSDSPGSTQRIANVEVSRTSRAYPNDCTADIPYDYSQVLIDNTDDVKTVVPAEAGVGKI